MARLQKSGGLLKNLPVQLVFPLFARAHRSTLAAGEVLFSAGEKGTGCYGIESGLLKVVVESAAGGERIVAIVGPGAIVGELAMIDGLPRSATVVALQDCICRFVSVEAFQKFAVDHPEFYRELVAILSARLREADTALAAASFLSVKGRVARALLDLAEHIGGRSDSGQIRFSHRISNSDLAAMAGVARENVSRVLGEWRENGLVTQNARHHCIHDTAALEREMEH